MSIKKHPGGLNIDEKGYESTTRGNPMFPCSAYWWDLTDPMLDEIPWHWHEEIEVLVVKSGALHLRINDKHYILYEGDGAYINANTIHSIRTSCEAVSTLNSLVFNAEILSGTYESVFNQRYVRPLTNCHSLPFILLRANNELENGIIKNIMDAYEACDGERYGYELVVREKMSQMLYSIVINNHRILQQQQSKSEDKDIIRLKIMLNFIHNNYTERISLQQIAASASVSERECLRCFNKTLGISPIQYLLKHRVTVAARLLSNSSLTITEVCIRAGFDIPSHFSRTFKSYMMNTPTEFRKLQSEKQ